MKINLARTLTLSSAAWLWMTCLFAAPSPARAAGYSSTILNDSPAAYWRLNESTVNYVCTNYGTAGANLNMTYNFGKFDAVPGPIAGDSDPAMAFDGVNARVEVPYAPFLNQPNGFSVEFWALCTNWNGANRSPVWFRTPSGVGGFCLFLQAANTWNLMIGYTNQATGSTAWGGGAATAVPAGTNVWNHVVATYGSIQNGANVVWLSKLYVNGVCQLTNYMSTNASCYSRVGTSLGLSPFRIGCGGAAAVGSYPFGGYLDEVAYYTNALSDAQVANHWSIATNAQRSVSYFSTVTNDSPLGYWRFDEPATTAVAYNQSGTGLEAGANGYYMGSPIIPPNPPFINPSNTPGTLSPLATGALGNSGDSDAALRFSTNGANSFGGKIDVPYNPSLNTPVFSVECWANLRTLPGSWSSPVSSRVSGNNVNGGFSLLVGTGGQLQFWLGAGGASTINLVAPASTPLSLNTWSHLVATFDGTNAWLYLNGALVGVTNLTEPYLPNNANPFRIGAGATESYGNFFCNGTLDEVASYPYALSPDQVLNHYAAGLGSTPTPTIAPTFNVQPPAAVTVDTGGSISLRGVAIGSLPIQYQWTCSGTNLPGQTNFVLNLANVDTSASGAYQLVASNGAGNKSSTVVNVTVNSPAQPSVSQDLPASTVYYPGGSIQLAVAVGGSLPLTYSWTSNNVVFATTPTPTVTLTNLSIAASGARIGLTIHNSYGDAQSQGTVLQAMTPTPGDYAATLLSFGPMAYWRLGESSPDTVAYDCWGGNNGTYINASQHYTPGALGLNDDGCVQLNGAGSQVVVSNGQAFVFPASGQFTLMAWVNPNSISGSQRIFSTRQINASNPAENSGFAFGLTNAALRFSTIGVTDTNFATALVAGRWYHLTAVYSNKMVTVYTNGVVVGVANAAVNDLISSGAPLCIGGNADGTEAYNGLVDEAAVFGYALSGAQIKAIVNTQSGSLPLITQQPTNFTAFAQAVLRFNVQVSGSQPLSYQWYTNGTGVGGQTNNTLLLFNAQSGWTGGTVRCVVTNASGSATSDPATMTVAPTSGYLGSVLADRPVGFWRLDEPVGPTVYDIVGAHDGTANANVYYNDSSYAAPPLSAGGDSDPCMGFYGNGDVVVPFAPELNQPVFTIECWTFNPGMGSGSTAPVSSRMSAGFGYNLYANATAPNWQFWTAIPTGGPWDGGVASAITYMSWTHLVATYDGTNKIVYVNGVPAMTNTVPFVTNYLSPLSFGAVVSANPTSGGTTAGAFYYGDIGQVAYYGYSLPPQRVMSHYLLASFGDNQAPQVAQDIASQAVSRGQTFALTPIIEGSVPMTYQWYHNNQPVPGAGGTSLDAYGILSLAFTNIQPSAAGDYVLMVTNAVGNTQTSVATITVASPAQFGSIAWLPNNAGVQLNFSGPANSAFRIWTTTNLTAGPVQSTWTLLNSGTFSGGTDTFTDPGAVNNPQQFYLLTVP